MKIDVLLLYCVFQKFRKTFLVDYGLDPVKYIGLPGLSWNAFLSKTGVKLELMKDVEMYNYLENSIRGGFSSVTIKYVKSNNKYMSDYDPKLPEKYIWYIDFNSLYAGIMTKKLPCSDFAWVEKPENLN